MTLTIPERKELERRVASRRGRADEARRARCMLLVADQVSWTAIRAHLHCSDSYIARWTGRFAAERLAGLYSRHRGQPATTLTPRLEARILEATRRGPGGGATHWSTRRLGKHLGVSHMMVARVWAKHDLKPHRLERDMASDDPDFERKAADVIGLYLNPPQHAAVFCLDEKTAIQALDRLDPVLPLSPGRAERHGFEYHRHGTLSLYAALDVKTGEVKGKTTKRHTSAEFIAFLNQLLSKTRWAKEIHIVLDNLSARKTKAVEEFLAQHPQERFHFTPTYSSWLNQVELWFAKIQRDVISRGIFTSVADLARKLRNYIEAYAKLAKPFRWTYTDPQKRIRINEITGTAY